MSVKVSALCWKVRLLATEKLVLLRLADFADDQGFNIYPAVQTVADDCGVGIRAVQLTLKKLVGVGILVVINQGGGRRRTTEYAIDLDELKARMTTPAGSATYTNGHAGKGVNSEPSAGFTAQNSERSAGFTAPEKGEKGASDDINPEPRSPDPLLTVKEVEEEDDAGTPEGVLQQVTERVAAMAGITGTQALERNAPIAAGWLATGADPEADIYPAVANAMNRTLQNRIRGFAYFTDEIETHFRTRTTPKPENTNVQHIRNSGRGKSSAGRGSYCSRIALGLPV